MTSILGKFIKEQLDNINNIKLSYFGIDTNTISEEESFALGCETLLL